MLRDATGRRWSGRISSNPGIDGPRRARLLATLRDPERVKEFSGPWAARVTWKGGFKAESKMRTHVIEFDEPADLEADDSAASAHEHLLSALGSCLATGVVVHATARSVKLEEVEISLTGTFDNVLRWAGLSESGSPAYRSIEARAHIRGDADEDTLRDIWDQALAGSPVAQTIIRPTPVISVMEASR
jgi:uncharacterized OsmC-like protein